MNICIGVICLQVAACICLFSLDKQEAIPVDTHVWQLAKQHYMPHLKGQLCLMVIVLGKGLEEKGVGCLHWTADWLKSDAVRGEASSLDHCLMTLQVWAMPKQHCHESHL